MAYSSKVLTVYLIAVLLATLASCNEQKRKGSRIIGGQLTTIDKVPYLVQIYVDTTFMCGGSLVTPYHVVTAAHCVSTLKDISRLVIVAGSTYAHLSSETRGVAQVFVHPTFNRKPAFSEDVAVLKLQKPLPLGGSIQTIDLCNRIMNAGDIFQISGWGKTENEEISAQVRTIRIPIISHDKCVSSFSTGIINESMMCGHISTAKDSCNGDSGGPGVYGNQLCGIVSWGLDCANPTHPGVYTNMMSPTVRNFVTESLRK